MTLLLGPRRSRNRTYKFPRLLLLISIALVLVAWGNYLVQFPQSSSPSSCQSRRTLHDIQHCFPVRKLACPNVETWPEVQRCLFLQKPPTDRTIVHILGERHSGTKFLTRELQACFNSNTTNNNIKVHRDFLRAKHWFQPPTRGNFRNHVVVVVVRDPVTWTAAMHERPYHSPRHVQFHGNDIIPLDWKTWITKEWSTARSELDYSDPNQSCRQGFAYNEVVPCRFDNTTTVIPKDRLRGYEPIYELRRDNSGKPFANILELRAEKLVNFILELPLIMDLGGFVVVRYEDLLREGTGATLRAIAQAIGLPADFHQSCTASPPQPERLNERPISTEFRNHVIRHSDPQLEHLLGYPIR